MKCYVTDVAYSLRLYCDVGVTEKQHTCGYKHVQ